MKIHFVGISGIGMSSVALLAKRMGYEVSGSADAFNERCTCLFENGIEVFIGHKEENIRGSDVVVFTNAVKNDNPEMIAADAAEIEKIPRLLFMRKLIEKYDEKVIGVTGTDGKTSTTAMISYVLIRLGYNPTVLLGGIHDMLEYGNFTYGDGPLVYELDESDGYFSRMKSDIAVITNIKGDHLENYSNDRCEYFKFMKEYALNSFECVIPAGYSSLIFSENEKENIKIFEIEYGEKNVLLDDYKYENCICAIKVLELLGIEKNVSMEILAGYTNVDRRMSIRYENEDIRVIDDYAHTPQEIEYLLNSFRKKDENEELSFVLELHRYSRLKREFNNYIKVLGNKMINNIFILPIYSAYESSEPDLFENFLCEMKSHFDNYKYVISPESLYDNIFANNECEKKAILFCGAGNSSNISKQLSKLISEKILFFKR